MGKMKWKDEYSVGINAIDGQHKKIFESLLAIENAIEKREAWHSLRYLFVQLTEDFERHWVTEEALLEIIHYPHLEKHNQAHAKLNKALTELEDKLRDPKKSMAGLVKFFEAWFVEHVLAGDLHYVDYARRQYPTQFSG